MDNKQHSTRKSNGVIKYRAKPCLSRRIAFQNKHFQQHGRFICALYQKFLKFHHKMKHTQIISISKPFHRDPQARVYYILFWYLKLVFKHYVWNKYQRILLSLSNVICL